MYVSWVDICAFEESFSDKGQCSCILHRRGLYFISHNLHSGFCTDIYDKGGPWTERKDFFWSPLHKWQVKCIAWESTIKFYGRKFPEISKRETPRSWSGATDVSDSTTNGLLAYCVVGVLCIHPLVISKRFHAIWSRSSFPLQSPDALKTFEDKKSLSFYWDFCRVTFLQWRRMTWIGASKVTSLQFSHGTAHRYEDVGHALPTELSPSMCSFLCACT